MLSKLQKWLEAPTTAQPEDPIEVQVAALLIELARADHQFEQAERDKIRDLLARYVQSDEIDALLAKAEDTAKSAVSLHPMTSRIHGEYDEAQKREVMLQLWAVALADGEIDAHEEHLIRKLADLLHLPRAAFTQTREAAKASKADS